LKKYVLMNFPGGLKFNEWGLEDYTPLFDEIKNNKELGSTQ
jgi:hypothetical protein